MVDVAYEFLKDIIEHEEYLKLDKNREFTILIDYNSRNR